MDVDTRRLIDPAADDLGSVVLFEIAVDGCSRTKKVEFKCMASLPDASQKKRMESRNEAALGLPPRHFRCPNQGRACRLDGPGSRWECIMENDIEACGGCELIARSKLQQGSLESQVADPSRAFEQVPELPRRRTAPTSLASLPFNA